jgi:hypothetical protein
LLAGPVARAKRQREIAAADAHRAMELIQTFGVAVSANPVISQRLGQKLLLDIIGRQSDPDGANLLKTRAISWCVHNS